ncbi:MAG: 3'-5' exonuclease [Candidatus Competibacteraceae bacterium]|nr:3'-5' exonuclease [Candidatus Competibacteraceae bacterium]
MLSTELLTFYRQMAERDLTIVDLETTGFAPPVARAIEISIIKANLQAGLQDQITHLINPGVRVPEQITRLTGISQAMVASADRETEIWPRCWPWLSDGVFTAHNVAFDYGFVKAELKQQGYDWHKASTDQFCTVIFSRLMLPDLPSRSLPKLVEHFGFAVGRSHRAAADTLACWLLAQRLLTEVGETDDADLLERFGKQWLPMREVTQIFGCKQAIAQRKLHQAGLEPRISGRSKTLMYQRAAVERVFWETQGQQTSLF